MDHVEAYSKQGVHAETNFVTACNKCNTRKSDDKAEDFKRRHPERSVKGTRGEPLHWDGLSSLFLVLAAGAGLLTVTERGWQRALRAYVDLKSHRSE